MFAVVFPSSAQAQIVVRSFTELQRILKVDETVVITDESGRQTRGKVADVSAASLTVLTPEKQTFLERSVAQIRRTDSLWNGVLIGAGVGGAVFGVGWISCVSQDVGCEIWGDPGGFVTSWLAPAAGGIVGALLDRAKGNEPIYVTPSRQTAVAVSPWLGRKGTGISVSLRF
jgi:hypothetical protein